MLCCDTLRYATQYYTTFYYATIISHTTRYYSILCYAASELADPPPPDLCKTFGGVGGGLEGG
eukprot:12255864-Heterocapsa_arctica.AAC.1